MNAAMLLSAIAVTLGIAAILWAPAPARDSKLSLSFLGMLLLGAGMLLFLLGLVLNAAA